MPRPFFLFAPGAGAPSTHPGCKSGKVIWNPSVRWRCLITIICAREETARSAATTHRRASIRFKPRYARNHPDPIFLMGKHGRAHRCHVALEEEVAGLICLGYPLCGGGDRRKLRDKVLRELQTPILLFQGTRDPLCPLDLLEEVRSQMKAPNSLHPVEDGDHLCG